MGECFSGKKKAVYPPGRAKQAPGGLLASPVLPQVIRSLLSKARSAEEALQFCLDAICADAGWPIGHAYLPADHNPELLLSTRAWHMEAPGHHEMLREVTRALRFSKGIGIPGKVYASGKPMIIPDLRMAPQLVRSKLLGDLGLRSIFVFPVLHGHEVLGVLEFCSHEIEKAGPALLEAVEKGAAVLGKFLHENTRREMARR